uniref:Uncharacterized protein n=2 Tax=Caenorhabditis japonica TaxID=281687 RepID=A0A8R1HLP2_CAEJA
MTQFSRGMAPNPATFDRVFKFIICGAKGVGKKTLLQSFCTEGDEEGTIWTELNVDDEKVLIEATVSKRWEEGMEKLFDAVALVFSTTDQISYEHTLEIQNEIQRVAEKMPIVFIENKVDIVEESQMDKTLVEGEMKKLHKRLYRVSALKEFNVMHPFAYLIEKLTRRKKDENANERKQSSSVNSSTVNSTVISTVNSSTLTPPASTEAWVEPVATAPHSTSTRKDKCSLM